MPKQIVGFSLLLISCIYLITFLIKILLFKINLSLSLKLATKVLKATLYCLRLFW